MPDNATIVACASATGGAVRSLIRVSGPASGSLAEKLLMRPPGARSPLSARLRLTASPELPCLAWSGVGPRTYTGEDTLELLIPGNPYLVERVIQELCGAVPGVRRAEPGEFSARAYLNGRLTLEQAEGVAAMVAADRAEMLSGASAVLSGATGRDYREWAEEAATLLALVEAGIDFTDQEDVVAIEPRALGERVERLRGAVCARLGAARGREAASGLPRVALVGLPNAGKSTLFNALLGRARAVASPTSGTTRDVLAEPLTIRLPGRTPVEVELLDLPGLDQTAAGPDAGGQASAHAALGSAAVHVRCCELGRFGGMPPLARNARTVQVRTKADRPGWAEGAEVAVCALTGAGLDKLRKLIANAATNPVGSSTGVVVARHAAALRAAVDALALVEPDGPGELAAHHLRAALDALGEITGAVPPDEVIGRVFAAFCVGK